MDLVWLRQRAEERRNHWRRHARRHFRIGKLRVIDLEDLRDGKITQAEAARRSGVSRQAIHEYITTYSEK